MRSPGSRDHSSRKAPASFATAFSREVDESSVRAAPMKVMAGAAAKSRRRLLIKSQTGLPT